MELTGRKMSDVQSDARPPLPNVNFVLLGLNLPRDQLYVRIERRFLNMIEQGFLDEVKALFNRSDLHADLPAMRAVGYRQLWAHLAGSSSLDEAIAQGILATRHLARRQLIWMRAEPELQWIDAESGIHSEVLTELINKIFG
jgi:tRNA dimethylallyltransferase